MLEAQRTPAHLLIVGLAIVFVLAACAKAVTEDEAQPTITAQTIPPTEIEAVEAGARATIPAPKTTTGPDNDEPTREEPPAVKPPTLAAKVTPTTEKPDEPRTPEDEVAQDFGITEFLRKKVIEGKGVWPFVSLDDPSFITADEATRLDPLELVLGVSMNGEHKAYPTSMMWFHHVANDTIGGIPIAVTY